MRVVSLWRFPVKSMQGEELATATIDELGIEGDRQWALVDLGTGLALTARRVPELLYATARLVGENVEITLPDGTVATDDAALSAWLGRDIELRHAGGEAQRALRDRRRLRGRGRVTVVRVGRARRHVPRFRQDTRSRSSARGRSAAGTAAGSAATC